MTYGTTAAGTLTKEQTLKGLARLPITASTTITKGEVVTIVSGYAITSPTTQVAGSEYYVAIETVSNASGASGDAYVRCARRGHFVTVVADGAIKYGDPVKASTSTAGQVIAFVKGTDAEGLKIGVYTGREGGTIAKASTSPYAETITDAASFAVTAAADGDIIEIELT
jgi:hypothetical protein